MTPLILDAETYWDADYTLKKLTPEEYIRDERFKLHGFGALHFGSGSYKWMNEATFVEWAAKVPWDRVAAVCHNTRFDGAILAWRYGIRPKLWVDTMGMYRALHPHLASYALSNLGKRFTPLTKGDEAMNTKGVRDLNVESFARLGDYCKTDCIITAELFRQAKDQFTRFEYAVMDMTLRMFTEPILEVDGPRLKAYLKDLQARKNDLLKDSGVDLSTIMSNVQFAKALYSRGVEPPMKKSKTTGRMTFAFAKTDVEMKQLSESDDPAVQTLVSARLGLKSTILETRTARLIGIAERGPLPVPLNYAGAKITLRHSGGDSLNLQNLNRGSELRKGIVAPPGHKVVVGDSSNIELRLVMALAGQKDAIEKIRNKVDLYCDFASDIYGRTITKDDEEERFVGKQGMLSLQYMASAPRFREMLRQKGRVVSESESDHVVQLYRRKHYCVRNLWYYCEETVIPAIHRGDAMIPVDVNGWFITTHNGFALPEHLGVQYVGLHKDSEGWRYEDGTVGGGYIYGAKLVENLCQHAARQVVMFQALLVGLRYRVVHSVHDEIVCCVPEDQAEDCAKYMRECLSVSPKWAGNLLPVAGEVGIGATYGDAK